LWPPPSSWSAPSYYWRYDCIHCHARFQVGLEARQQTLSQF
jgi:hypothetical protein